jgi:chromatin segregation and condensation protein Rec8/ScpA/Scc1 (kleisin family)
MKQEQAPEDRPEENILKAIIEKESWEDVIYYIVSVENIDPWNVDLVKVSESFLKFVRAVKELDFRIPAKIVFVAAILLRLKSDYLSMFLERAGDDELKETRPFEQLGIDPNLVQLSYPMKRIPKRQVTLDELMGALKKAMAVKEKKEVRRKLWQHDAGANIDLGEESSEERINRIMGEIETMLQTAKDDRINFKDLVKEWKKDRVVERFVPILHLEQDEKIQTEQEDFFREVFIRKKRPKNQ